MDKQSRQTLARAYWDAVDDRDWEALGEVFTDDVEYHYYGGDTFYGPDEVVSFLRDSLLQSDEIETREGTHEVFNWFADGETTVGEGRSFGTEDGVEYDLRFINVFEFDEDTERISQIRLYIRPEKLPPSQQ